MTFTATHTGQGQEYTFSGNASEVGAISTSAWTFPTNCDLELLLLSPSGSTLANGGCAAQSETISGIALPGTGTYTIDLVAQGDNIGSNVGSVTIKLTS